MAVRMFNLRLASGGRDAVLSQGILKLFLGGAGVEGRGGGKGKKTSCSPLFRAMQTLLPDFLMII